MNIPTSEEIKHFLEMKQTHGKMIRDLQKRQYDKLYYQKNKNRLNEMTVEKRKAKYANDDEYREQRRAYQREYQRQKKKRENPDSL